MGNTHLVIPDQHVRPGISNERFVWLARFILDLKPNVVINLGDACDMESLCSYDKGKKSFEGRRYKKDIESVRNALMLFHNELDSYNLVRRLQKKRTYNPRLVFCGGNHDLGRINRAIEAESILDGTISYKDFGLEEYGWEVYNFLHVVSIDGIAYSHYFCRDGSSYAIGGKNAARSIITENLCSSTCGHSHKRDYAEQRSIDGRNIQCLVAGHFMDELQQEEYAGPQGNNKWADSGIVVKRNVKAGQYDLEFIPTSYLRKTYANT